MRTDELAVPCGGVIAVAPAAEARKGDGPGWPSSVLLFIRMAPGWHEAGAIEVISGGPHWVFGC